MKAFQSILASKSSLSNRLVVYASYRTLILSPSLLNSLHKWSDSFFFHIGETSEVDIRDGVS